MQIFIKNKINSSQLKFSKYHNKYELYSEYQNNPFDCELTW